MGNFTDATIIALSNPDVAPKLITTYDIDINGDIVARLDNSENLVSVTLNFEENKHLLEEWQIKKRNEFMAKKG